MNHTAARSAEHRRRTQNAHCDVLATPSPRWQS